MGKDANRGNTAMRNSRTAKTTKMQTYMGRLEFRLGYDDYISGKPMRDEDSWTGGGYGLHPINQQWTYERGRHFAAWCKSLGYVGPFKRGRQIEAWAIDAMAQGQQDGVII